MGADYFLYLYLKIEHRYGVSYIELSCERGYFCDCLDVGYDSDTDNKERYDNIIGKIKELYLTPSIPPILIYKNGSFINSKFEEKYSPFLDYKFNTRLKYWRDTGVLEDKEDIIKIYKIEVREMVSL